MMDLETKKKLVEWMGWKIVSSTCIDYYQDGKGKRAWMPSVWNPDTDHIQFKDVWNNLNTIEQAEVLILLDNDKGEDLEDGEIVSVVLNDLPKLMTAVLKVLKEK